MKIVEQLAHAEFLLRAANKKGVNIHEVSDDPLSLYMTKKRKTTEVGVMAHFDCPMCTSLCIGFIEECEVCRS